MIIDGNKKCSKCGLLKSVKFFNRTVDSKDGLYSSCKPCRRLVYKQRKESLSSEQKEKELSSQRARTKVYYKKNTEKCKQATRDWQRRFLYGIDTKEYNELFEKQGGCCAICEVHQTKISKALAIDHNHITGIVRGLLCIKCNTALGHYEKLLVNADLVNKFKKYLGEFSDNIYTDR